MLFPHLLTWQVLFCVGELTDDSLESGTAVVCLDVVEEDVARSRSVYCDQRRSVFASTFIEYDQVRNHGCQIAHGILAEVDDHPFDLDKLVLMDWRDSHLGDEPDLRARR